MEIKVQVGFIELLQISLIVLRLADIINWSWVWVLAPAWISIIMFVTGYMLALISQKFSLWLWKWRSWRIRRKK